MLAVVAAVAEANRSMRMRTMRKMTPNCLHKKQWQSLLLESGLHAFDSWHCIRAVVAAPIAVVVVMEVVTLFHKANVSQSHIEAVAAWRRLFDWPLLVAVLVSMS